jgi:hypothetical protein
VLVRSGDEVEEWDDVVVSKEDVDDGILVSPDSIVLCESSKVVRREMVDDNRVVFGVSIGGFGISMLVRWF